MIKSKENSQYYTWGDNCSGWHLVKSDSPSIIEELMPPKTQEKKHHHNFSQQFFRILSGKATFEIEMKTLRLKKGKEFIFYQKRIIVLGMINQKI